MARGSLKDPFKKQEETPMKLTGQQIGQTAGAALGTLIPIPGVGTAIGGMVGGAIGGMFDKKGGKQDPQISQAERDVEKRMKAYENIQFQASNPYEDMTVNLKAAEFQRDMQAQEQADTLQALRQGAGGAGAAALATAMSRQAAQKQQAIAADIGQQEQVIQIKSAQQQVANEQAKQQFEIGRMETMLGMDMAKVTAEQQARLAAEQGKMDRRSQALGSVMDLGGTVLSAGLSEGGFLNK